MCEQEPLGAGKGNWSQWFLQNQQGDEKCEPGKELCSLMCVCRDWNSQRIMGCFHSAWLSLKVKNRDKRGFIVSEAGHITRSAFCTISVVCLRRQRVEFHEVFGLAGAP